MVCIDRFDKKRERCVGADGSITNTNGTTVFWTLNADGSGSVGSGGLYWDTQGHIIGNFVELYNNGDLNVAGDIFATGSVVAGATNGIAPTDLPVATGLLYGVVKLDDSTIKIDANGKIYAVGAGISTNVNFGTATSQYTPLTINAVTRNLSVDGHTHSYLPLSGGTLTNSAYGGQLAIDRTSTGGNAVILYKNSVDGWTKAMGVDSIGRPVFDGSVMWHAGNDGAGSGLDADLLDGFHAILDGIS